MILWDSLLTKLVTALPEPIIAHYNEKMKLKHAIKEAKLQARIDLIKAKTAAKAAQQAHYQSWEMAFLQMQNNSYKDEIVLATFLWPFWGVFIPGVQDYVLLGFDYLTKVPYWWTGIAVTISLAIYGIRHVNANRISAPGLKNTEVESNVS